MHKGCELRGIAALNLSLKVHPLDQVVQLCNRGPWDVVLGPVGTFSLDLKTAFTTVPPVPKACSRRYHKQKVDTYKEIF